MKFNLYAVRDNVADDTLTIFTSKTDGMAVRENLPTLSRMRPTKDLDLYQIGEFDSETMKITETPKRAVSWDSYKFPEIKTPMKTERPEEPKKESK